AIVRNSIFPLQPGTQSLRPDPIVKKWNTQRDGEQIKERIIPTQNNQKLKRNQNCSSDVPHPSRPEYQKGNNELNGEHHCAAKRMNPAWHLMNVPTRPYRQWLSFIMNFQRGQ